MAKTKQQKRKLKESKILGYPVSKAQHRRWGKNVRYSFYWRFAIGLILGAFFGAIAESMLAVILSALLVTATLIISHFFMFTTLRYGVRLFLAIISFGIGSGTEFYMIHHFRNWTEINLWTYILCGVCIAPFLHIRGFFTHPTEYDDNLSIDVSVSTPKSVKLHGKVASWIMLIGSLLFTFAGLFILFVTDEDFLTAIGATTFFGACAIVAGYMIRQNK